jgi:NAD(P)-dependent dehydrogenase (short-subunit alcohol dehydrogenase family)
MGSGTSAYATVEAAKAGGKTAEEIQEFLSSGLAEKITGKNVVVTGCSGIGGAFAQVCLAQGAGKVFVVDRQESVFTGLDFTTGNLVKVLCDVGTKEGPDAVSEAVGDLPIHYVFMCAACPKNVDDMGHRFTNIGYDDLDDMIKTDAHGKLFVVQRLQKNFQAVCDASNSKPRVFTIGAPFSDGPKPDGKYMVIPGWAGFGVAKAACKWVYEGMKVEMSATASFGYGHPGFTKTPLIDKVVKDFSSDHMLSKMCTKRISAQDYHTPVEAAKMFYAVMTATDDAEFCDCKWNIVKMYQRFGKDLGAKEISDVKAGIAIPEEKK